MKGICFINEQDLLSCSKVELKAARRVLATLCPKDSATNESHLEYFLYKCIEYNLRFLRSEMSKSGLAPNGTANGDILQAFSLSVASPYARLPPRSLRRFSHPREASQRRQQQLDDAIGSHSETDLYRTSRSKSLCMRLSLWLRFR